MSENGQTIDTDEEVETPGLDEDGEQVEVGGAKTEGKLTERRVAWRKHGD